MNYNAFSNCYEFQWLQFPLFVTSLSTDYNSFLIQRSKQMPKQSLFEAVNLQLGLSENSAFSLCQKNSPVTQKTIFSQAIQNSLFEQKLQKIEPFLLTLKQDQQQNIFQQKLKNSQNLTSLIQTKKKLSQSRYHENFDQQIEQSQFQLKKRYLKKQNNSKSQKQGRNKFSNILRSFLKFISKKSLQTELVKKIIKTKRLRVSVNEFHNWIQRKSLDFRNYIRPKAIKKLFVQVDSFPDYNLLTRILFNYFLKNIYHIHLLSSAKMTKKSWETHLAGVRQVFNQILSQKLK